jgi:hypothetical protein
LEEHYCCCFKEIVVAIVITVAEFIADAAVGMRDTTKNH